MATGSLMGRQAKKISRDLLRRLGYEVRRIPLSRETIAQRAGADAPYYAEYSTPWPIFAPWTNGSDFRTMYADVAGFTAGTPERAYMLVSLAGHAKHLPGDFAESGVYQGGSALLLCRALQNTGKRLYLFDSFEGLPQPNSRHDPFFQQGEYAAVVEVVKERLSRFNSITDFRKGWIPDTFAGLEDKRFAFAHIDVDLYQPTLDSCRYFYPRVTPGGVMLFDEYGFSSAHGEKVAVDEFFADKPEQPIALITGQAFVLKLPPK
ncbi:MAG: TylF/MycF/NovP-related O-methyltransferase [Candidatus Binatia bacterium]